MMAVRPGFARTGQAASLRPREGTRMATSASTTAPKQAIAAAAVTLWDVSVAFRLADGGVYTAVERATLNVADGEFVAIVGPTGCGKSTLLNVIAGLQPPASGRAEIFGAPLAGLNRQ